MSDPLTALMHAVQVMNLLKTLITKASRERDETTTGGYSPMSFHSSDRQSDEEFDSHQDMDTSCELRGPASDYDDQQAHYSHSNEDDDDDDGNDVESLTEVEGCFLKPLDKSNDVNPSDFLEESAEISDLHKNHGSSPSWSAINAESSSISFTDYSKTRNSSLSTSDEEVSGASFIMAFRCKVDGESPSKVCEDKDEDNLQNMIVVDELTESI